MLGAMRKLLTLLGCAWLAQCALFGEVLIVADEFPAMEVLSTKLKAEEGLVCRIVAQSNLPPALGQFEAVIVYIHRDLSEAVEEALILYTEQGGRLVPLHHSISSGKARNRHWFGFLGVNLPKGPVEAGGYKWTEGVSFEVVNLAPEHFITSHKLRYPAQVRWQAQPGDREQKLPGFSFEHSEVYLNHVLKDQAHTRLLGLKYIDPSGKIFMQGHAGWVKPAGRGWIVYLLPGHSAADFQGSVYPRLVANAVIWKPQAR